MNKIDLRSDTLTKPTISMMNYMAKTCVGDDAYEEDNMVKELEKYCQKLFNKEASLFIPSGTMSNQVAIRTHTTPGDEIITDKTYHVNFFESSQTSVLSGVNINLCESKNGIMSVDDIKKAINSKFRGPLYSKTKLVSIENTVSTEAGNSFSLAETKKIYDFVKLNNMNLHMDGARIFNACVAKNCNPSEYANYVDSLTFCFSKSLGAPFGSMLLGSHDFIRKAILYRKWFGGQMHQIGFMAAAALHAIQSDWKKDLQNDHSNANKIVDSLKEILPSGTIKYNGTNIITMNFHNDFSSINIVDDLKQIGVLVLPWNDNSIRMVTYKDLTTLQIDHAIDILTLYFKNFFSKHTVPFCRSVELVSESA